MEAEMMIKPIAHIETRFPTKFGVPRQSGRAPSLVAKIEFLPEYAVEDAFREIEGFSHLWVLFDFSKTRDKGWTPTVRPPRLGGNTRVGVFASRSPFRPNHIGLSCVKLLGVERGKTGISLLVSGADLLDGTPVFDVKPYLPFADSVDNATGGYASAHENERLKVVCDETLITRLPKEKRDGLLECLADDPRPSYQEDESRVYGMKFADFEIKFTVKEKTLTVVDVQSV